MWDQRINEWLDAGHGSCILARAPVAQIVESALRHFDGERYLLGEFVVMPNHVHALVAELQGWALSGILHSWKLYTAHRINDKIGRKGQLWQDESFDHIVRDDRAWMKFSRYIAANGEKLQPGLVRRGCGRLRLP